MLRPSTNIIPKYRYETHYNYVKNSGFERYPGSLHSPLLHYHYVSTSLTMQIPAETLSQTHRVCFMLLCYRFVSTTLAAQIPSGNAIANSQGLLHAETGLSYFGARYYDSDLMTGWLSVDPLADKYPGLSPYNYCAWNPIKLVDPDGNRPIPLYNNYNGWYVKLDSRFGLRNPQIKKASRFHKGIDLNYSCGGNNDLGSPILATHDGIASIDNDPKGGEGRSVTITATNGKIRTRYFHLQSINISEGDIISESDEIGKMGGSGYGKDDTYTSHLHYEIQININNEWVSIDPTMGEGDDVKDVIDPQKMIDSGCWENFINLKDAKIISNKLEQ